MEDGIEIKVMEYPRRLFARMTRKPKNRFAVRFADPSNYANFAAP
jgi:hypothetical protein